MRSWSPQCRLLAARSGLPIIVTSIADIFVKRPSWFQVVQTRGSIDKGQVQHWQVTLKVGFVI